MKNCIWMLSVVIFCSSAIMAQQSKKSFDAPLVVAGEDFRMDDLADLDADGDLDGIGWFWTNTSRDQIRIAIIQNDNGRFFDYNNFSIYPLIGLVNGSPATMWDSCVGNVDADPMAEYVLAIGNNLMVVGRSPTQFYLSVTVTKYSPDAYTSVALADYDNDGDLDIVASDLAHLRFFLNDGLGGFVDGPIIPLSNTLRVVTGDVTLDGVDDVIALYANDVKVFTVLGGIPTLDATIVHGISQDPAAPIKPSLGDVDGDFDLDVVIFNHLSNYAVLRNDGLGNLVAESPLIGGPAEKLVDIDGDGDLDGVCCGSGGGGGSGGGDPVDNTTPSTFMIAHNDGTGVFTNSVTMPGLGAERLAGAADIDNDGDIDLVGGRCVYYAEGPLIEPIVGVGPVGGFGLQGPTDIDGDFDQDFLKDITTARLNLANGTFVDSPMAIQAPVGYVFDHVLSHGDFDNDGHVDFICQKLDASTLNFVDMHLIQGNGNGHYTDAGPCTLPGTMLTDNLGQGADAKWSLAADADNDGDLDFIAGSENHVGASLVWFNDGNGLFTAGLPAGPVAQVIDLDGDGLNDIVGDDASVRWGQSDGTWAAGVGAGPWPSLTIQVVDFENDGLLDILGTRFDRVLLYKNLGNRNFVQLSGPFLGDVDVTSQRRFIFAGNLDGDAANTMEIVTNGPLLTPGSVQVFEGNIFVFGFNTTNPQSRTSHIMNADFLFDIDNDGDLDMIGERIYKNMDLTPNDTGIIFQYGQGVPGSGGFIPRFNAKGPLAAGEIATLKISGLLGGTLTHLVYGNIPRNDVGFPLPSLTNYTNALAIFDLFAGGTPGVPGDGTIDVSFVVPPNLSGIPYFHQIYSYDPGAVGNYTNSAGLAIRYQ